MVSLLVKVVTLFFSYIYPLGFANCQLVHYFSHVQEN